MVARRPNVPKRPHGASGSRTAGSPVSSDATRAADTRPVGDAAPSQAKDNTQAQKRAASANETRISEPRKPRAGKPRERQPQADKPQPNKQQPNKPSGSNLGISRPRRPARPAPKAQGKDHAPVPARTFSGRTLAFAALLVVVVVMVTPTVRLFITEHREVAQTREDIEQAKARQNELKGDVDKWKDDSFVIQKARSELNMVKPGERQYIVTGTDGINDEPVPQRFDGPTDLPWGDAFWESVKRAAAQPKHAPAPPPAPKNEQTPGR